MGHVFDQNDADFYVKWQERPRIKRRIALEHHLMERMMHPLQRETVLEIGCGTGLALLPLMDRGIQVTGLDASAPMLEVAARNLGKRADLHCGPAEELPFDDNSFTYSILHNTLEFVEDPEKVLEETFRVTKDRVFIGFMNRHSGRATLVRARRVINQNDLFSYAAFLSLWELKRTVRSLLGNVPVSWRTIHASPVPLGRPILKNPVMPRLILKSPLSPFIGMRVTLSPRYRTRVLRLECRAEPAGGTLTGLARTNNWRQYGRQYDG